MAKAEVEVITLERRRRHWSRTDKERIVAAALQPGATILGDGNVALILDVAQLIAMAQPKEEMLRAAS